MKKITPREMKWINKGKTKALTYNRFYAMGKDSYFLANSDENFEFKSALSLNDKNFSIIVSITQNTYYCLNVSKSLSVTTSIKGFSSTTNIDNTFIENKESLNIKLIRDEDNFSFYLDDILISNATLPASKDAISFGFYFNNDEFIKVSDFLYIKNN